MFVFEIRWLKNTPISETVGNGLSAVPETFRIELRQNKQVPVRHGTKASLGGSWLALWARLMREMRYSVKRCGNNGRIRRNVSLPLPLGEVAERSEDGEGQR